MGENSNLPELWPGWETVRKIGTGSYGSVYEIQRDVFGDTERAALKQISLPQSPDEIRNLMEEGGYDQESITVSYRAHLESIISEYKLMQKVKDSPNVVHCDDFRYVQHDDGIGYDIYIKMELLNPLTKSLMTDISEETVLRTAIDLCSGLEVCEKQNIIHRDIKPQNIFVSENGNYKLGDFGIARVMEETGKTATMAGTVDYMAPEVMYGQHYDATVDIYSLGLVLYWMLNDRRLPFMPASKGVPGAAEKAEARNRRMKGEQLPAPAHGSEALKQIVLKACAFKPEDRYQTATEMHEALIHATDPVIPPSPEKPPEKKRRKGAAKGTGKKLKVIIPLVVVLLAAAIGLLVIRPFAKVPAKTIQIPQPELAKYFPIQPVRIPPQILSEADEYSIDVASQRLKSLSIEDAVGEKTGVTNTYKETDDDVTYEYHYDADTSNLTSVTVYQPVNGDLVTVGSIQYSEDGAIKNATVYFVDETINGRVRAYYERNSEGNLERIAQDIEEEVYNANNRLIGVLYFTLDDNGEAVPTSYFIYARNENGLRTAEWEYYGEVLCYYREYLFDNKGNQTGSNDYDADGVLTAFYRNNIAYNASGIRKY